MKPFFLLLIITVLVGLVTKAWASDYNVPTLCDVAEELHSQPVDLDAIAYAIAVAESGNCSSHLASVTRNCHSIRRDGAFVSFASKDESYAYFKRMWSNSRYYAGGFPTCDEARLYTSDPNPHGWMLNVWRAYNRFLRPLAFNS